MSKAPTAVLPPPPNIEINHNPCIRGKDAARQWIADNLSIELSPYEITKATNSKALASHFLGGAVHFSTADLWAYISGTRRSAEAVAS